MKRINSGRNDWYDAHTNNCSDFLSRSAIFNVVLHVSLAAGGAVVVVELTVLMVVVKLEHKEAFEDVLPCCCCC